MYTVWSDKAVLNSALQVGLFSINSDGKLCLEQLFLILNIRICDSAVLSDFTLILVLGSNTLITRVKQVDRLIWKSLN